MPRSKSSAVHLTQVLEASERPIYVLNDQRRIVYCNAACAAWAELAVEELIGQSCAYHSQPGDSPAAEAAAALCPPPAVFSGELKAATVHVRIGDGAGRTRRGVFVPMSDGADASSPVLAILELADADEQAASADGEAESPHERIRRFRRTFAARHQLEGLIGQSPASQRVRAQVALAAATLSNILVVGPPGSGKSHVAKAIHYRRASGGTAGLVPLDCGVLSADLLVSTLAALATRSDRHGGNSSSAEAAMQTPAALDTILLDHIDQLPSEAQAEVTRLIEAGPLAGRAIATAREPLTELTAAGKVRHDLACALSTLVIELTPLSARLEDLPLLAQWLLEDLNAEGGKQVSRFTPDALDQLAAYAWPRNLEELAEVVRESHERAEGHEIGPRDLPKRLHLAANAALHPRRIDEKIDLEQFLARVERELIERALARAKGNKSKAAKLLGLTRPRLYRRLVQLGLEKPEAGAS